MGGRLVFRVCGVWLCCIAAAGADPRTDLMNSVTVLRRDRDFAGAADRLRQWIEGHADDGNARLLLGQVQADGGDEDAALRTWTDLLQQEPIDVALYRAVILRLQGLGRLETAVKLLQSGTKRSGSSDPFAWERAELLLASGDWAGAVDAHRAFLRQEPHRRPLVENRIATMARDDAVSGTVERGRAVNYRQALATAIEDARGTEATTLALLLAACALETGDPELGLETLRDALDGNDVILQALFQYASRCETAGQPAVASRAYELFARHAGNSPYRDRSLLKQAEMRALAGDVEGAIGLYADLSSGGETESSETILRVAQLQAHVLRDPAAASKTLNLLQPGAHRGDFQRRLLALRADCRLRLDDLAGAADEWRRLVVDPDGRGDAEFGLAELAFFQGHLDSAAAFVDSLVRRQPTHRLANDALDLLLLIDEFGTEAVSLTVLASARLRQRQGRFEEAGQHRQWLQREAPSGLRHVSLLETADRLESSDPTRAMEMYSRVADDDPAERHAVSAALGRARLLEAGGSAAAALRTYETTVLSAPLDPRTPDIRRHITRLRALGDPG